jgi:acyl-coenzyme A thioesterase PaaI-like protein
VHEDEGAHFIDGLGLTHEPPAEVAVGRVTVPPGACLPGTDFPRASVLLTYADVVAGMQASLRTQPRVSVTVDLNLEVLTRPRLAELELRSRVLRSGSRVTVSEVAFVAPGTAEPFALSVGTFMASPRAADVIGDPPRPGRGGPPWSMQAPLADHVGLRVLSPGLTELHRRPDLGNSSNSLQGGLVALLAETAAESLASARAGRPYEVRRLDVRYLAAVRVGPGRAAGELLHLDRSGATVRVEIHDAGRDHRQTALVMLECRPAGVG